MPRSVVDGNVLLLSVYPARLAGPRLRGHQYRPYLEASGLTLETWSFIRDREVTRWFGQRQRYRAFILLKALLRLVVLPRLIARASVVVILREVAPLGPPIMESLIARKRPLIWDVDDAVWEAYPSLFVRRLPAWLRKPSRKYERLCAMGTEVWAGSEVLAEWCRKFNATVRVVPSVVDVPQIRPQLSPERVAGWIGSPSTQRFLEEILPSVRRVEPPARVVAVGGGDAALEGVEHWPWSTEAEERALSLMRVGLYPIDRGHPLAEGKCGLKAILYMSRGIPPILTATTTNAQIVRHEVEGLHVETLEDWTLAIQRLLEDNELWERLSEAAHNRALESYSLQVWGPKVADYILSLTRRKEPKPSD